jgi:glycosyltransferase involved in cell wall biosynthesis
MKPKVMLFSFPLASATVNQFTFEVVRILDPICDRLIVVMGKSPEKHSLDAHVTVHEIGTTLHPTGTIKPTWWSHVLQSLKIVFIQLKMCSLLFARVDEIDTAFFYMGGFTVFLPVLAAKFCRKRVLTTAFCSARSAKKAGVHRTIAAAMAFFEKSIYTLSDVIAVESPAVIASCSLGKYKNKITTKGARFVDVETFESKRPLQDRSEVVGYFGRLSAEKGVLDFVNAVPLILRECEDATFLIGGAGPLYSRIADMLTQKNLAAKVKMQGWIPFVPPFLNELKILVVPSYSEGLPTVALQAMACETPVVATLVGGIPDIIVDGETGFIIECNSAESIAEATLRALTSPDLDGIVKNARCLVQERYSLDGAIKRYKEILNDDL